MFKFTDKKGREWDLELTFAEVNQVSEADYSTLGFDEFNLLSPDRGTLGKLFQSRGLTMAVIWVIVRPQAMKHESFSEDVLSEEVDFETDGEWLEDARQVEFMSGISGEVYSHAFKALWEAISDFFPEQKSVLSALQKEHQAATQSATEQLTEVIPLMREENDRKVKKEVDKLRDQLRSGRLEIESSDS